MKIHRLQTYNINSLYGSFTVDFDQYFKNVPLFLIHGPTGAGKSTLLDAICLALYGQTPRLTSSNKSSDQSSTQYIMSHGTSECHATVMFSLRSPGANKREYYRAEWSSERAHKKSRTDGDVKPAQRSLFRVDENGQQIGEPLAASHKPKDYQEHFDNILQGMDINAFQRSVMLAQGQFSEFLKANDQQKNAILERLTDTSHYRDIGARAAARKREMDDTLQKHKTKMADIKVLTPEVIHELNTNLNSVTTQANAHEAELKEKRLQTHWIDAFLTNMTEHQAATDQLVRQQKIHDEHAEDFNRLERDKACQPAAAIRQRVHEIRKDIAELENRLPELREAVTNNAKAASQAEINQKQAATQLTKARIDLTTAQPALQNARELQAALFTASQEVALTEHKRKESSDEHNQAVITHKLATQTLEAAARALSDAQQARQSIQYADVITKQLVDWQTRASNLVTNRIDHYNKQADLKKAEDHLRNLTQNLAEKNQQLILEQTSLTPLTLATERTQEAINLMLHTNNAPDISSLRTLFDGQRQTSSTRKSAIENAFKLNQKLETLLTGLQTFSTERDVHEKTLETLENDQKLAEKDITHVSDTIENLKQSLQGFAIALSFDNARRDLADGCQCPVCGSIEHPYKPADNHAQAESDLQNLHDTALVKQNTAEKSLRQYQSVHTDILTRTAACEKSLQISEERIAERAAEIQILSKELLTLLGSAGFETENVHNWTTSDYETHITDAEAAWSRAIENVHALQTAIDAHTESEKQYRHARDLSQELNETIRIQTATLELQSQQLQTLHDTTQIQLAVITKDENALVESLNACNIEVPKINEAYDISAAITQAETLKRDFDAAYLAVTHCAEQTQLANNALLATTATLDARVKHLESTTRNLTEREQQKSALQDQYRRSIQAFDDKTPDIAEAEFNLAIQKADELLEAAQAAQNNAREALTTAQAELDSRTRLHNEFIAKLTRETSDFTQKLTELNLDEQSLETHLLNADERTRLQNKLAEITDVLNKARAVHAVALERFEKQKTLKPDALQSIESTQELSNYSKTLAEEANILDHERDSMNEQIGRFKEKLAESDRASEEHLELQQQLEQLERDSAMWNEIHKLIGTGSGENFQRFAQSLNLGELVRAANRWLKKLFPRYELGVLTGKDGEPTLTFTIIDRENAGNERPINTLSGGETFVVSLALALALADFSQIRMPLETILLDEGFGTLDSDTLDSILNVLNTLQQQSGRQIGIISHVDGLTERIDNRIHVQKKNSTQSSITIITGDLSTDATAPEVTP